ncbi:hypothetical protein [Streptomyces sp. NPDC059468]|uniref:hypothetical protein n=1 Tax=Streptomyces sp. NPDC059468 TaxID=3346845 RepID=UPI0036820F45
MRLESELASVGAEVLVARRDPVEWTRVRKAFAAWFKSNGAPGYETELRVDPWPAAGLTELERKVWFTRVRMTLDHAPDKGAAAEQLHLLIGEFAPAPDEGRAPAPGPEQRTPRVPDHVDFRRGTFHGPVVGVQNNYGTQPGAGYGDPDNWPTVEEVDLMRLGVRRTRRFGTETGVPDYVPRDVDEMLRGWQERDGLLVVTGGPSSGKTRTAWAAMFDHLPLHARVYVPPPSADLRGLPGLLRGRDDPHVLWLDELERHLGDNALDLGLLAELARLRVPVVATMSDEEYDRHRFGAGPASRLLSQARTVPLSSRWSEGELRRLAQLAPGDPQLADALRWRGDSGVTQYLAVGPELWELWRRAALSNSRHPRGHLVVRAAIDLVRCGVTGDIPRQLLEAACVCYGAAHVAGLPETESFEDGLAWAAERRQAVTGMLVRGVPRHVGDSDETWRPYGSLVADVMRDPSSAPVPLAVWRCALDGTRYDADVRRGVLVRAYEVVEPCAEGGDAEAMQVMGLVGEAAGDEAMTLAWFRRAVDAGRTQLAGRVGEILLGQGKAEQALPYLRTAAQDCPEGSEGPTARLLGQAYLTLAEQWLGKAAKAGDAEASHQLGDLLLGRGDIEEASDLYVTAESHGHAPAARSVGVHHLLQGEGEAAQVFLSRAADTGDERAAALLHMITGKAQTVTEAEASFEEAMETTPYPWDHTNLGVVLEKQGRESEALRHYEQGSKRGDAHGAYRLALLLEADGDADRAKAWYRKAAALGHPAALKALGETSGKPDTVKE